MAGLATIVKIYIKLYSAHREHLMTLMMMNDNDDDDDDGCLNSPAKRALSLAVEKQPCYSSAQNVS